MHAPRRAVAGVRKAQWASERRAENLRRRIILVGVTADEVRERLKDLRKPFRDAELHVIDPSNTVGGEEPALVDRTRVYVHKGGIGYHNDTLRAKAFDAIVLDWRVAAFVRLHALAQFAQDYLKPTGVLYVREVEDSCFEPIVGRCPELAHTDARGTVVRFVDSDNNVLFGIPRTEHVTLQQVLRCACFHQDDVSAYTMPGGKALSWDTRISMIHDDVILINKTGHLVSVAHFEAELGKRGFECFPIEEYPFANAKEEPARGKTACWRRSTQGERAQRPDR